MTLYWCTADKENVSIWSITIGRGAVINGLYLHTHLDFTHEDMKRFFAILSISLLIATAAIAQKAERVEKLKSELRTATTDSTQIHLLITLAMTYQGLQMDSAMSYAEKALALSKKVNDKKGEADALLHIGRLKRDRSETVDALNHMTEALKLYRQIKDSVQIANSLNDISIIYANSGDYKNSLHYFKQALDIFKQSKDEKGESYALNNIGIIYQEMNDIAMAKDYFLQSQKIKIKRKDLYG